MKKQVLLVILLGSLVGYFFGSILFKNYKGSEYINQDGNIYYVQYGVYTTNESALENTKKLDNNYLIKELDGKYYVYLAITEDYNLALKIQKYYKDKNIYSYIRTDYVENSETLEKLKKYDNQIKEASDDEIVSVMKEILDNQELNL